ncbi:N-glycosylase/DNA lyase [Plasmodium inui San Antonio 1]|uniref:DNA-(apurinic or apyrimidinic site) lyase n=1 Tax=Plasmodium inui San Antonio 1 TaxID=1237626 RepID=W7AG54_9APIC|nr:N-glycosylase/DNA lyase [Plasmodium inui San Antonio 1]EUD67994.1 N-glycosylase/DNA lyase [Plasmodium inui San Antonio 1]
MILHIFQSLFLLLLKNIYISTEMRSKAVGATKMSKNFPDGRNSCVKSERIVVGGKKEETRKKGATHLFVNTISGDKKRILKKVKKECGGGGIKGERMMVSVHPPDGSDTKNINVQNIASGTPFFVIKNFELRWKRINVTKNELQLKYCFLIGQEFCFSEVSRDTYIGLVNNKIYLFKETEEGIFYQCVYDRSGGGSGECGDGRSDGTEREHATQAGQSRNPDNANTSDQYEQDVNDFFNLQFPLSKNIKMWKKKDKRMKEITDKIKGLRILKTNSVESFFSFLCSTNNNIPRITLMIDCLRRRYGKFLATVMFHGQDVLVKVREDPDAKGMALNRNQQRVGVMKDEQRVRLKVGETQSGRVKREPPKNGETKKEPLSVSAPKREPQLRIRVKEEYSQNGPTTREQNGDDGHSERENNRIFYENLKTMIKEERQMKIFPFYEFPTVEILSQLKEKDLRNLGFGYRSSYVIESAKMLVERGSEEWIEDLKKEKKTKNCIDQLILFPGIGLKVANCICLFGLNKFDCIPIDTHIYDIIYKYYRNIVESECASVHRRSADKAENVENATGGTPIKGKKKGNRTTRQATPTYVDRVPKREGEKGTEPNSKPNSNPNSKQQKKALTISLYIRLYTRLKNLLGPNCGWAQTILFASELKKFSHLFE